MLYKNYYSICVSLLKKSKKKARSGKLVCGNGPGEYCVVQNRQRGNLRCKKTLVFRKQQLEQPLLPDGMIGNSYLGRRQKKCANF